MQLINTSLGSLIIELAKQFCNSEEKQVSKKDIQYFEC